MRKILTATISPSWPMKSRKEFNACLKNFEKLGFPVLNRKFKTRLLSPKEKAAEIHAAFRNSKAELIIARRGGYSSMKALPYIDYKLIGRNPKIFAGFSDISTLLNTLYERCNLVTLHSPMIINFEKPSRFTVKSFLNALSGFPDRNLFAGSRIEVFKHGKTSGTLKGGNLITLSALLGTQWETETSGAVVFFEDVDEKLHEIDRCLTHWIIAGKFKNIRGLILGDFRGSKPRDVYKVITEQMKVKFPVVFCENIGHVRNKITLPVGAKVELDTRGKTLLIKKI